MDNRNRNRYSNLRNGGKKIMVTAKDFETLIIVVVVGIIGIGLAMLIGELHTQQIIVHEAIGESVTLQQLQTFIIAIFLLLGVLVAAVKK